MLPLTRAAICHRSSARVLGSLRTREQRGRAGRRPLGRCCLCLLDVSGASALPAPPHRVKPALCSPHPGLPPACPGGVARVPRPLRGHRTTYLPSFVSRASAWPVTSPFTPPLPARVSSARREPRAAEEQECVSRYVASGFWRSDFSARCDAPRPPHALAPARSSGVSRGVSSGKPSVACAALGQHTHQCFRHLVILVRPRHCRLHCFIAST